MRAKRRKLVHKKKKYLDSMRKNKADCKQQNSTF